METSLASVILSDEMEQLRTFSDERLLASCVYCGCETKTRDHVPAKVFLDHPYPENLPVVPACNHCNQNASRDEEYLACLIECAISGTAEPSEVSRPRIQSILARKPRLASRLANSARFNLLGELEWQVELNRVKKTVLKLARGHAAFELSEPRLDPPCSIQVAPLNAMAQDERGEFESPPLITAFPEIGSRSFQRIGTYQTEDDRFLLDMDWVNVQDKMYRYLASVEDGTRIRIVLSEYLGCEVIWQP